jgi:hypothetical protein
MRKGLTYYIHKDTVHIFLAVFLIIAAVSIIQAEDKFRAALFFCQYPAFFFMMYLVVHTLNSEERLNASLNIIYAIVSFISLYIIILSAILQNRDSLTFFLLDTINFSVGKVGIIMEVPISILLFRMIKKDMKLTHFIIVAVATVAMMSLASRGTFIAWLVMIALLLIKSRFRLKRAGPVFLVILIIALCFSFLNRTNKRFDSYLLVFDKAKYNEKIIAFSRFYTAKVAYRIMLDAPLTGAGLGNLSYKLAPTIENMTDIPDKILEYWRSRDEIFMTTCSPLKLGAETGVPGFLFFFVFFYYIWRRLRYAYYISGGDLKLTIGGMQIALIVRFIHEMADLGYMTYFSWFYFGMFIAASRIAVALNKRAEHNARGAVRT